MVVMYMQEADEPSPPLRVGPLSRAVVAITAAATIVLGLAWGPLIDAAQNATVYYSTTNLRSPSADR
jgi:NADH:ubiquinone oxidoreductase subunit 2 (subunit N)